MTRRDKHAALTELCAEILADLRSGLNYNARYRDVGTDRRAQDEVLGDPAYYLETYFAPDNSSRTVSTLEGAANEVAHSFQVSFWLEYEDGSSYEQSSQSEYDRLVEGTDGLLPVLRGAPKPAEPGHPNISDWPVGLELGQPEGVSEPIVDLDSAGRLAHLCRFEVTLTHSTL